MKCFIRNDRIYITDGIDYRGLLPMYRELKFRSRLRLRMDDGEPEELLYIKLKTGVKLARLRGWL